RCRRRRGLRCGWLAGHRHRQHRQRSRLQLELDLGAALEPRRQFPSRPGSAGWGVPPRAGGRGRGRRPYPRPGRGERALQHALGDVNADGRPDVAVVSENEHIVSTLYGNGDGTLGARTDHPTGQYPKGVQIVDLDGDGFPELVVANALVGSLSVFPGTGPGTFGPAVEYETGRFPEV